MVDLMPLITPFLAMRAAGTGSAGQAAGCEAGAGPRRVRPWKIAWLARGDESHGIAQAMRGLIAASVPLGVEPVVLAFGQGRFCEEARGAGWPVRVLGLRFPAMLAGSVFRKGVGYVRLQYQARALAGPVERALRDAEAQAVHVLWPTLVPPAGRAAASAGIPCLWEMPNAVGPLWGGLKAHILRSVLARYRVVALANSQYTLASLGTARASARLFYLGADSSRFFPDRPDAVSRALLGIPADAVVLVVTSILIAEKGHEVALRAMASLAAEANLHLVIVGGPLGTGYHQHLLELARVLGQGGRVHFAGEVPDPERYYGLADVAVNARVDPEPFGLSVIEGMMAGRPVLVHALGGPAETVLDGVTGWHVQDASAEAFAVGLRRALRDRPKWPEMGRAARQRAMGEFEVGLQARRYVGILDDLLGCAPGLGVDATSVDKPVGGS